MTPREGADAIRLKAWMTRYLLRAALTKTADRGRQIGIMNSSGPYSYALLAQYGHPYSRWRPNPAFDPSIINVQSGRFRNGWRSTRASAFAGGLRARIVNQVPYAGDLVRVDRSGLRTIRRPIDTRVRAEVRPYFEEFVQDALYKAVRA